MRDQYVAVLPQTELDEDMLAAMRLKVGTRLRIEHSVNNDFASPIAVARFAGGIGDINPLWTDLEYGNRSLFGAPVAPPSFVIGCFSGIQFGWPGLGSFHSASQLTFHRPVYWGDTVTATCVYDGFDGPSPSTFAGRTVTDRFTNTYTNQCVETIATVHWQVINFERGAASRQRLDRVTSAPELPHTWTEAEVVEITADHGPESLDLRRAPGGCRRDHLPDRARTPSPQPHRVHGRHACPRCDGSATSTDDRRGFFQ
jgi:acyl dehydratase